MFEEECKAMRRSCPQSMPMIAVYAETKTKAYTLTHTLDQPHFVVQYDRPSESLGSTLVGAVLVDPPEGKVLVPVGLEQALTNTAQRMGVEWTSLIKVYRRGQEQVGVHLYDATEWWCKTCSYKRAAYPCWKCGPNAPGYRPLAGLGQQELPDVNRIREIARSCGYAIGEHGSKERDLDLIAVPWTEEAVDVATLIATLAKALETPSGPTRIIGPEAKPWGRVSYTLHLNGWYKAIDISITQRG